MADYTPRAPEKFTNADSSQTYTFPVDDLEWEPTGASRRATANVIGADFGIDFAGGAPWARDFGEQGIRFSLWGTDQAIDDAFDTLCQALMGIGAGKLWAIDASGDRRWCWAKLDGLPTKYVDAETLFKLPVSTRFVQESDWYSETDVTDIVAISTSPQEFTVTNTGNKATSAISFRLRSNGVAGFTSPIFLNVSNGYTFTVDRTADDADSDVLVDCDDSAVEFSDNNGATYVDDYANFDYGDSQNPFMVFEPGDNLIRVTDAGTPDFSLEIVHSPTWHSA